MQNGPSRSYSQNSPSVSRKDGCSLAQKVVWITGASSGIGQELAIECCAKNAIVILSGRDEAQLKKVAALCSGTTEIIPFDLNDRRQISPAVEKMFAAFGRIDVMIHCAGVSQRAPAYDTSALTHHKIMQVNFEAPVEITRQILSTMRTAHYPPSFPKIVVVGSLAGLISTGLRSSYSAAKHALHAYFNALRIETAIHILLVIPGFINTEITRKALVQDGATYGHMDPEQAYGMTAVRCARRICRAMLKKNKNVLYVGLKLRGQLGLILSRMVPRRLHKTLKAQYEKNIIRIAKQPAETDNDTL